MSKGLMLMKTALANETALGGPILKAVGLSKNYRYYGSLFDAKRRVINAIKDLTFDVMKNEVFAVVGETGCGKSTLAKVIAGLTPKTSGELYFEGSPLDYSDKTENLRKKIQIMFQDPYSSLNPKKKIYKIISYPAVKNGIIKKKERVDFAVSMLKSVGLSEKLASSYPHMLSGGQRQRVGMARSLSVSPALLVLDEPLSALDVSISAQVLNLLMDKREECKMSYIFITHDLKLVRHVADRVCVMFGGRIAEISTAEKFFEGPAHPYSKVLYDSMVFFEIKQKSGPAGGQIRAGAGLNSAPGIIAEEKDAVVSSGSGCVYFNRCVLRQDICAKKEPVLADAGNGRMAACFFL